MVRPHILLVDDDVYVVESLKTYMEILGYRVSAAYSFDQALRVLRGDDKIDLVVLDYLLPDGSGMDLLRSLDEQPQIQKPRVIMSSGVLDAGTPLWEMLKKQLSPGAQSLIQAYVSKPYTLDAMDVALHEVLGGDYIPGPRLTRTKRHAPA